MRQPYHTSMTATAMTATGAVGSFATLSNARKKNVIVYLRVTAASGTSPSLTVKVQGGFDGTNWADIPSAAFAAQTAATAAGTVLRLIINDCDDEQLRIFATISGTTPSFTFTIDVFESNDDV